ncbi:hypothetical protein [Pararhizobium antarcticum]|uniref:Uncharacterized protein n=1 Tax=Pararhizobium antarcticum TaxID=1798805 RepID=A0A657LYV1_9HYPH|nr:hypothetical protein [Pararhizobium antarcticum]OJF90392.1 hypothetical protein AX761_06915 [Rhizobium sp. 58]OJG00546.1 hypothetical protein AX760_10275 [Pararhizobium antarcticum]
MAGSELRAGFTGAPRNADTIAAKAADAAHAVKEQALSAKDAAADHPHSLTLVLALAGVAGFLIGHLSGFRAAERQLAPPEPSKRRYW